MGPELERMMREALGAEDPVIQRIDPDPGFIIDMDPWGRSIMDTPFVREQERQRNREATERLNELIKKTVKSKERRALDRMDQVEELTEDGPLYPPLMPKPSDRKAMKEGDTPFHFESGKSRVDQIPPRALLMVGQVMGYGAKKYGDWNWAQYRSDWKWGQLIGSTLRHIYGWMMREDLDPESGLPHLAHATANLMMLLELIYTGNGEEDRNPIEGPIRGHSEINQRKGNIGTL